ncbi:MAG: DMT family transporter, partial [Bdellovibrionota bacterium]
MIWAVIFFGIAHALVKWAPNIPFYQLAFLRQLLALILCVIPLYRMKLSPWGNNKILLFGRGLAGSLALTAYFSSLQSMPLASAVTIQYLSPVMTLIFAHFFLSEKTTLRQFALFLVGFAGVLLVKGFDGRITDQALIVSLFSVVLSALAYTSVRALRGNDHQLVIVFYFSFVSLPLIGPFAAYTWVWPTLVDWSVIFGIGVLTWLAQISMTMAYQKSPASEVAIYNNLGIFIALILGYLMFGETFNTESLLGMVVIFFSVILSSKRLATRV